MSLIIRDAQDDGRKALKILREYYRGNSKPRVILLYTELASLKMGSEESVTDYVLRAETSATALKAAGEVISDSLLTAMVLKGLPDGFRALSIVITQKKEEVTFGELKSALRSFEENEKCRYGENGKDNVMKIKENVPNSKSLCYSYGKPGHKKFQCKVKLLGNNRHRWCNICKNNSRDTNFCRKRYSAKGVSNDDIEGRNNSFMFKASLAEGAIRLGADQKIVG